MGLDTVEIVMSWEASFGIRIEDSRASQIISVKDAIDFLCEELDAVEMPSFCPPRRALLRVHEALRKAGVAHDREIRLQDSLLDFRRFETKSGFLLKFDRAIGIEGFKTHHGFLYGTPTVKAAAKQILCNSMESLKQENEPWTRSVVRYGVRAVVADVTGIDDFQDSDRFIEDLRLD